MGLMDKLKRATGTEDNYNDYNDDYYDEFERDDNASDTQSSAADPMNGMQNNAGMNTYAQPGSGISLSGTSLELKVVKPQNFDSVSQIADHLLNKRTVVLNLENTNKETARRLIDFLSGVAYSIDGSLKKVTNTTFVITPSNVNVGEAQLRDKRPRQDSQRPAENDSSAGMDAGELGDF